MLFLRLTFLLLVVAFAPTSTQAQVNIIQAPANYEFLDSGYDEVNDEVAIVGYVLDNNAPTNTLATIFELNAAKDAFTTQTLADLPGATQNAEVTAISSDASRIAGFSTSSDAIDIEGTTWLRSSPSTPTGIGFIQGSSNRSSAVGAWKDGVVGESGGTMHVTKWTQPNSLEALPGTLGGGGQASDVSSNGEVIVGISPFEVSNGAAYYWDNSGIHRLDDNIPGHTLFQSVAESISPNGNYIGGRIIARDENDNIKLFPVIWEGANRTLRILEDQNGDLLQGQVSDVSDLGFVVGTFFDANFDSFGFIWSPDFTNGVRVFEDWLEEQAPGAVLPFTSFNVNSIAIGNDKAFFTVAGAVGEFALVDVVVAPLLGDVNQDGVVDFLDIAPFISVLSGGGFQDEADVDRNGTVDFLDIGPFIAVLSA